MAARSTFSIRGKRRFTRAFGDLIYGPHRASRIRNLDRLGRPRHFAFPGARSCVRPNSVEVTISAASEHG